jgi:hypothetical protein
MTCRQIFVMLIAGVWIASCGSNSGKSFVPSMDGYHDKQRKQFILPDELLEISGLVHLDSHRIAGINDERGEIFFLNLDNDSITTQRFKGKGDYEELVKVDSVFFVLDSKGHLIEINSNTWQDTTHKFDVKGKKEFESLVWYRKKKKLVMITKDQRKKSAAGITAYSFDLATRQFDAEPFFEIRLKDIFTKLENFNAECKPSAAAISPVNGHLYIVASIGKLILECTAEGQLLKIFKINPGHFPQPEGISFAANGDMYISNEGLEGKATILKYPYVAKH